MPESLLEAGLSRRNLLKFGGLTAAGVSAFTLPQALGAAPAAAATAAKWPGHVPGKILLGVSSPEDIDAVAQQFGKLGTHRTFHRWSDLSREVRIIKADHAAGRLPWISFKPPGVSNPWAAVASGAHDQELRARARTYAELSGPVVVTFNHEPQTDSWAPADFVRAWTRVHDIMKSETGLKNVAHAPIIGEWVFSPVNRKMDPEQYLTPAMLDRCAFVGIDLYQNGTGQTYSQRLGGVLSWLDAKGYPQKMVGLGETGCADAFGTPSAADWWKASWAYAVQRVDRVGVISYFHSTRNNHGAYNWKLTETAAKAAAFKDSLRSPSMATLGSTPASTTADATSTTSTPSSRESTAATVTRSSARAAAPAEERRRRTGSRWRWAV